MDIDEVIKKLKSDAITDSYNFQGYSMKQKEQIAEWLKELQFLRQWKLDVMEDFCRYDASSFEEIIHNVRNRTINEFVEELYQDYVYDSICRDDISFYGFGNKIKSIAEQMKER